MIFYSILQRGQLCIETQAVMADFNLEALPDLDRKRDGSELIGQTLQRGVASPYKRAASVTVRTCVNQSFVAGEGQLVVIVAATGGEEAVAPRVPEKIGGKRRIELDGAINGSGHNIVIALRSGARLGNKPSSAILCDGECVPGRLELRVLEAVDDMWPRCSRWCDLRSQGERAQGKRDEERKQGLMRTHTKPRGPPE